jgi:hypothetical protein
MPAWICRTCGVQHADTPEPPATCAICLDERQYVGWDGQQWTTRAELARDHAALPTVTSRVSRLLPPTAVGKIRGLPPDQRG